MEAVPRFRDEEEGKRRIIAAMEEKIKQMEEVCTFRSPLTMISPCRKCFKTVLNGRVIE